MIETFYGHGGLNSPSAYFAALIIGLLFGFILERAGFGSSRRLAGIFYFRDMAVLKVMFTALITGMLGLSLLLSMGLVSSEQLYFMQTVYGAQIVGGLIFGVGFVMSGWCPGTGAVGLGSGKLDALIFLCGVVLGSILFNELFAAVRPLYNWAQSGVVFVYDSLGLSKMVFAFLFTSIAIACFWGAEYIERRKNRGGFYFNTPFLKAFSLGLLIFAGALFIMPASPYSAAAPVLKSTVRESIRPPASDGEQMLLARVEAGLDHINPTELADRMAKGEQGLLVVDVRTAKEFQGFHLRGAVNVPISDLSKTLRPYKNKGIIVLYSNGMTHPAQAADALYRLGYENVYILTDGLKGFIETCLKPVSLRSEPIPEDMAERINAWRSFFYAETPYAFTGFVSAETVAPTTHRDLQAPGTLPGLVETEWLASNLDKDGLKSIDLRSQPEYNTGHIPGSFFLSTDSLRGVVDGIPSLLLPAEILALHMAQMGIEPSDLVVLVPGDKVRDATLAGMAFERLGHRRYAVLNGGFGKWAAENRQVDTKLPVAAKSSYHAIAGRTDKITVGYQTILEQMKHPGTVILDVRPEDYYLGKKSDEARAGHIPGAVNRPYSEDIVKKDGYTQLRPIEELAAAYASLFPSKDTTIIVHCRTGHQASQTFFVLKNLLGYKNVLYYDAGWTEWAARPELPVEVGPTGG